jgi:threonine dehydrogenase-like Zn-dependent dehydrogenase
VDLKKEIDALTDGYGCDVYIELTGNPASVRQGLDCIARQGRFVEFAVFGKDVAADWSIISKWGFKVYVINVVFVKIGSVTSNSL